MRRASEGVWWASPLVATALSLVPTVLAIFLQIHLLTLHDVLKGVTFSADGTNLGSALLLTAGRLPYDNFALAQPPGMTVLMLPFAWAAHAASTNGALSGARIVTSIVCVLNVLMVALLTRRRGLTASIVAGCALAIYPFAFEATGSALFEPWLLFFCLLGLLLAFPAGELQGGGRLIAAGVLLGFAVTIKPWAIVPAAVILVCTGVRWREMLLRYGGGLVAGVVVPCIFFLLAAPGAFWRDVVVAELRGTSSGHSASVTARLAQLLGLGAPVGIHNGRAIAAVVAVVIGVAVLVFLLARLPLMTTLDWVVLAVTVLLFALAFVPTTLPTAYGYFLAGFAASVFGTMIGNLLSLVSTLPLGEGVGATAAAGGSVLLVALTIGLVALTVPKETSYEQSYFLANGIDPVLAVQALVPPGACAVSNNPSVLIVGDRLLDQPDGCPAVMDPVGMAAAAGPKGPATTSAITQSWEASFDGSHFILLETQSGGIPWTAALAHNFRDDFLLAQAGRVDIYTLRGPADS